MIQTAYIRIGQEDPDPLTTLGGLTLLKRSVLTAQHAGAKVCYVRLDKRATEQSPTTPDVIQQYIGQLNGDPSITTAVLWLDGETLPRTPAGEKPTCNPPSCLYFSVATVFSRRAIAAALGPTDTSQRIVRWLGRDTEIALTLGPPPTVVSAQELQSFFDPKMYGWRVPRGEHFSRHVLSLPAPTYHLSNKKELRITERELLASMENPKDGLVDRHLNRKLSRPLTRMFLRTSLTPNHVTIISCAIGLCGAACFFQPSYLGCIFGSLLLQLSCIVDCCDGEIARMKFLESPFGAWLDMVLDTVVHIATFGGLAFAVWSQGDGPPAIVLGGALIAGTLLAFAFVVISERMKPAEAVTKTWQYQFLQQLVAGLASRDYSLAILVCAVLQKLAWFLCVAAIGVHVFWVTLAALLCWICRHSPSISTQKESTSGRPT